MSQQLLRSSYLKVKVLDIVSDFTRIAIVHEKDASRIGAHAGGKIRLMIGDKSLSCTVLITKTLVNEGYIGIDRATAKNLGVEDGDTVGVRSIGLPRSFSIIRKKLHGQKLSSEEIRIVVREVVDGTLTDGQIAAFLIGQIMHGMSLDELEALTRAMVDTGTKIEFEEPVYDEHSVGGVPGNSKVALVAVPTIAAAGVLIPKTSSRAITSPAGTADTMEVLARVALTPEEIKEIARKVRATLAWGGALNMAPADDIFVKVESTIGIDPQYQMVASILAKKLAMDVSYVTIDIPVGPKAKVRSTRHAEELATYFITLGKRLGIKVRCLLTNGSVPIGTSVGPALEAKEALEVLYGKKPLEGNFVEKALIIAASVLEEAGKAERGAGVQVARRILESGKALEKMKQIIEAQGGDPNVKPEDVPVGSKHVTVYAEKSGRITSIDNAAVTLVARTAGAPHDKGAGIKFHVTIGQRVKQGDPLFTIYAESSTKLEQALRLANELRVVEIESVLLKEIPPTR